MQLSAQPHVARGGRVLACSYSGDKARGARAVFIGLFCDMDPIDHDNDGAMGEDSDFDWAEGL